MVTLDVEMPGMDGLETLKAIQQFNAGRPRGPEIGVIMVMRIHQRGADVTVQALRAARSTSSPARRQYRRREPGDSASTAQLQDPTLPGPPSSGPTSPALPSGPNRRVAARTRRIAPS
jgi:chemotaxis response regulator CheB